MRVLKGFIGLSVILPLLFITTPAYAQSERGEQARVFGQGQPHSVRDLPAGKLRNRLEGLPPQASSKALRWLQDFSFPEADLATLEVDDDGAVFYGDTLLPEIAHGEEPEGLSLSTPDAVPAGTLENAFLLHSRPGASNVVYIDFDGATITGTAWNGTHSTLEALPYNVEGDAATFSDLERTRIVDIWHRVAEDLAPFDIDVTTEEPSVFNSTTGTILVTHTYDANGNAINCTSCGGVAYVNVFGRSDYHTKYSPALVFYNKLGSGGETYVAEASSHEFGHNLGLSHDGTTTGQTYYGGHGTGLVSWAPIMGNSYNNNVTEWSRGEYTNANQTQDDLAMIEARLGYEPDDHGDTRGQASYLAVAIDGSVVSSNPELDPDNTLNENKGIIGSANDVDVFAFTAGAGLVELTVTPSWDAFYRSSNRRGANLDVELELLDQGGASIASSEPVDDTAAAISTTVNAGTYYLQVTGTGNSITPYSDYNSLGQFFINGSVPVAAVDDTAPLPNPMGWASTPVAISDSAISMTATTAVDETSPVEYNFLCVAGDIECNNAHSGWQSSSSYTASGLTAGTSYTFQTLARDLAGNETGRSASSSATTDEPPPYTNYVAGSETAVAGTLSAGYSNTFNDDGVVQAVTEIESGGKPSRRHSYLEHRWNFNISAGATVSVHANAWSSGSSDGDTFRFEYSLDNGSSFSSLFVVSQTSADNQQEAVIPGSPSGAVIIRVIDTDQSSGNRETNTITVDHLYIQVGNPSNDPPDGQPGDLSAEAVSFDQVNLSWINGTSNESGFRVERSLDGNAGWFQIADLSAGSSSYSDTGLTAETTYFYRVSAYTQPEMTSAYASGSVTTPAAPPQSPLGLSAGGYKTKGVQHIDLSWSGSTSVQLYRNNTLLGTVNGNSFVDNTGNKGGGTYTHKVCDVVTGSCSNTTTTTF
jgi:hypothetical protein